MWSEQSSHTEEAAGTAAQMTHSLRHTETNTKPQLHSYEAKQSDKETKQRHWLKKEFTQK